MTRRTVPFDEAEQSWSIDYRLHPIDVGFDLRATRMPVVIDHADSLRVSHDGADGERYVTAGAFDDVIAMLREAGYVVYVNGGPS